MGIKSFFSNIGDKIKQAWQQTKSIFSNNKNIVNKPNYGPDTRLRPPEKVDTVKDWISHEKRIGLLDSIKRMKNMDPQKIEEIKKNASNNSIFKNAKQVGLKTKDMIEMQKKVEQSRVQSNINKAQAEIDKMKQYQQNINKNPIAQPPI